LDYLYPLASRERLYKVAWPGYTPEKDPIDVVWTTLYPLPGRERLYKVACPGYTPEKNPIDVDNDFDIDICLAVGFVRFRCFLGFSSMR
jgi:hypothetical protein